MMKLIGWLFGKRAPQPRKSMLRVLSSAHGDREFPFVVGDATWREADALVRLAPIVGGATLLLVPGGDPAKPAEKIKSLAEVGPGDEALLLPRVTGG